MPLPPPEPRTRCVPLIVTAHARSSLQWERYMRCDGLPDPLTRQEVTAYLSSWRETAIESEQHPEVMRRTDEVLRVIDDLERHVRDKAYGDGELAADMAAILQQYQASRPGWVLEGL